MPIRKIIITPGEYYHLCNRSNDKQNIFIEDRDWIRFLFIILYFQSTENFNNLSRLITHFVKHRVFNIPRDKTEKIIKNRDVELIIFCLMPNHFHLLVRQLKEKGVSRYMQRVQNAYAKYFNAKYKKSGHLFQGPFRIAHVKNNEQMLYLSAYIHRNCRELKHWQNKECQYPWSSFQDYCGKNRWGKLLEHNIISDQFPSPKDYKKFIDASGAKLKSELDENTQLE